jgi:hypothetical protein
MTRGLPTEGHLLKSTACDVFYIFVQIIAAKLCVLFNFLFFIFGRPANKAAGMESRDGDLDLDEFSR